MKTKSKLVLAILPLLATITLLAYLLRQEAFAARAGDEYWRGDRMPDEVRTKANLSSHKDCLEGEWFPTN